MAENKENLTTQETEKANEVMEQEAKVLTEEEEVEVVGQVVDITPEEFKTEVEKHIEEFQRRTVTLPSKRKIKKTFKEEEVVGDDFNELIFDGRKRAYEYKLLSDSARSGKPTILKARVFAIEKVTIGNIKSFNIIANFIPDPTVKPYEEEASEYRIVIPAPQFFFYNPEKYEGVEGYNKLRKELEARIGSLIDFIVYQISADDKDVIASRIAAMQLKSYEMYLSPHKKVDLEKKCLAHVLRVGRHGLVCDVLGAECYIPNSELSWNYITAANEVYEVGDKVPVRVKKIETNQVEVYGKRYIFVSIEASIKDAVENPAKKYFDDFEVGQKVNGRITMRLDTGEYFVLLASRMSCKCKPPYFANAQIGQSCVVVITEKNREDFTIKGSITYLGK